jgi:hypothetical protein
MNLLSLLYTISIVVFYTNLVHTSAVKLKCQCTCCVPTVQTTCELVQLNSITSNTDNCQTDKCRDACRQQNLDCELRKGIIDGACSQSMQ